MQKSFDDSFPGQGLRQELKTRQTFRSPTSSGLAVPATLVSRHSQGQEVTAETLGFDVNGSWTAVRCSPFYCWAFLGLFLNVSFAEERPTIWSSPRRTCRPCQSIPATHAVCALTLQLVPWHVLHHAWNGVYRFPLRFATMSDCLPPSSRQLTG